MYTYRLGGNPFILDIALINISSNANILSNFLSICSNLFHPFLSRQICGMFADVIQSTNEKLKLKVSVQEFAKYSHRKIVSMLALHLIIVVIRANFVTRVFTPISDVAFTITYIYKEFRLLYISFFIDFVHFILCQLNENIRQVIQKSDERLELVKIVRSIKGIHFSLWKISMHLNSCFSLSLVVYLLESFFAVTVSVYAGFLHTSTIEKLSGFHFMRKYFHEFIIILVVVYHNSEQNGVGLIIITDGITNVAQSRIEKKY